MKNVPDEEGNNVFFVINYEEGGFIIMSADKRTSPVFAHSLTGEFKFDSKSFPLGLISWLASTKDYVKAVRKNGDKFKVNEKAWKEETIEKIVGNSSTSKSPKKSSRVSSEPCEPDAPCGGGGGGPCSDVLTVINPLVTTNWGQGVGYNDETPLIGCGTLNGHAPTGCVATAMAQIMNFHRSPSQYSWDNMQSGNTALTTLMKDIGEEVDMTYGCDVSGANTENEAASSLVWDFGYSSAQYASCNYSTVMNELNSGNPVILKGGANTGWWIFNSYSNGHAWVCDGYQQYYFCEVGVTYLHLHMNWGWDGRFNGLYAFNNFNPTGFTFNYERGMVYNIRP